MDLESKTASAPGRPHTAKDAAALSRFDSLTTFPIVLAALLPLVIPPESGEWPAVVVGVLSWLVFLADYVVNERRLVRYTSTWLGRLDLAVVVLTAPWYLVAGANAGSFIVLLRLARLARVVMASKGAGAPSSASDVSRSSHWLSCSCRHWSPTTPSTRPIQSSQTTRIHSGEAL